MFHCRAQTIIRVALAMVAPPFDIRQAEFLGLFKRLIKEVR